MTPLKLLSADDIIAEIRRLYFRTSKDRIQADLTKAVELLKSMKTEEERERATVYLEGLNQMRADWSRDDRRRKNSRARRGTSTPASRRKG